VEVAIVQRGAADAPRLHVAANRPLDKAERAAVTVVLQRLLGLNIDLSNFHRFAARDRQLGPLVQLFRGMKPPRFATVFECLINAMACQQVTLTLGIRLLNDLAAAFGPALETTAGKVHAFPRPEDLASCNPAELRQLGFSLQKGRGMIELAQAVVTGQTDLEGLAGLSGAEAIARLCALRGVGRWTAEYVLLRGLGRIDVFPGDDVGARNNLQRWLGQAEPLDYEGVRKALSRWQTYAGLVYFHLLLDRLAAAGELGEYGKPAQTSE
jgi:DNA-3-methyladenine glycosylase II